MNATQQQLVVSHIDDASWHRLLSEFRDASIYQTIAYGSARWGRDALCHARWMGGDRVEAMAQVVVRRMPVLGGGLAYVPWGPVWRHPAHEPGQFRAVIHALREEFAVRRGLLLRLAPRESDESGIPVATILNEEGYHATSARYRTRMVDLSGSEDELHRQLNRSWRRALKRADELRLNVEEGSSDDLYREFALLYHEMVRRKGFRPGVNVEEFERMQHMLPPELKMHIMICRDGHRPMAALMASHMGDTGVGLLGATATEGLSCGAFHTLNLAMMRWLKSRGAQWYDFGGYEPEKNHGTASFKEGLPGRDVSLVGAYESSTHPAKSFLIHTAEQGRRIGRAVQAVGQRRHRGRVHVHLEKAAP